MITYLREGLCKFARSTEMGNAKASTSGTGKKVRTLRFFCSTSAVEGSGDAIMPPLPCAHAEASISDLYPNNTY